MPIRVLFVFETLESEAVQEALAIALKQGDQQFEVLAATSEESAHRLLPGDFSLVITPLDIRKNALTPISASDHRGLALVRWITSNMKIPCVLVAPTYPDELIDNGPGLVAPYFVPTGGDMIEKLASLARKIVNQQPTKSLDIDIQLLGTTQWSYQMTGKGFPYGGHPRGLLQMDQRTMEDMYDSAKDLDQRESPFWKEKLKRTGDRLLGALWSSQDFISDIFEGLEGAGGESKARVRFSVAPAFHSLPLEALTCPKSRNEHWMLHAPFYRRLLSQEPATAGYLFEGGNRIETLIIESPTSGMVQNPDVYLPALTSVSAECSSLRDWLTANQEQFNLADPVLVRAEPGLPPLAERVQQLLETREWGIVHYCGHSHYVPETQAGFVFFPGTIEGSVDKIDITKFSGWLRKSKFVYLSSCSSGAGPFMFELANRRVSNLIGFRWPISDQFAAEHAQSFYQNLFAERSFEQGLLKTRQAMHESHPEDPIWAAPLLIMQLGES